MKETTSFYGVKEQRYELNRNDVVKACVEYIKKYTRDSTFERGEVKSINHCFKDDSGLMLDESELSSFVYVETFKRKEQNEMSNSERSQKGLLPEQESSGESS